MYGVKALDCPDMQPIGYYNSCLDAMTLATTLNQCHGAKRYEVVELESEGKQQ